MIIGLGLGLVLGLKTWLWFEFREWVRFRLGFMMIRVRIISVR